MADIGFYHLTRTTAEAALPPLLARTLAAGARAVIRCGSPEQLDALDRALWLCADPDWLPHGTTNPTLQPIFLTLDDAAPNRATYAFFLHGTATAALEAYSRVFDLFDGTDAAALAAARTRWTQAKAAGHTLTYWQQTPHRLDPGVKLETTANLYFVLAVFVPGFIYSGVLSHFVPQRLSAQTELIVLRLLTATAFNYALCSPVIWLLTAGALFAHNPVAHALTWFGIIFVVPILLALARARIVQSGGGAWFYRRLRLRPISAIPTGWDWIFGRTDPCYMLVTLLDGTQIPGFFGHRSMASSDPDRRDLFIERLFTIPNPGAPWQEVFGTLGIHIAAAQIATIEFRR